MLKIATPSVKLELYKKQAAAGQYDAPYPSDGDILYHLYNQLKAKQKQKNPEK